MNEVASPFRVPLLVAGVGLGAATVFASSLGWLAALAVGLPSIAACIRAGRLDALSGLLLGFGAIWSLLVARVLTSGAAQDNAIVWMAVGLVPLTVGAACLVVAVRRARSRAVIRNTGSR